MTIEQHAEAIRNALLPITGSCIPIGAEFLAACQALRDEGYQAGRADMAKEIGPYMKVDPSVIMPQSCGTRVKWTGNPVQTSRGVKP